MTTYGIGEFQMRNGGKAVVNRDASPSHATVTFTRSFGMTGQAYDPPGPNRAYTYEHQPNNIAAYRLGKVASMKFEGGDYIDFGLQLLRALQEIGFGVFEIEPAKASASSIEALKDQEDKP